MVATKPVDFRKGGTVSTGARDHDGRPFPGAVYVFLAKIASTIKLSSHCYSSVTSQISLCYVATTTMPLLIHGAKSTEKPGRDNISVFELERIEDYQCSCQSP